MAFTKGHQCFIDGISSIRQIAVQSTLFQHGKTNYVSVSSSGAVYLTQQSESEFYLLAVL